MIEYTPNDLTISAKGTLTVAGTGYDGTYDGESHGEAATTNVTAGTTISYSTDGGENWSTEVPKVTDVSEITVNVKAENPNYVTATGSYTLKVNPATITVTADAQAKTYGDADPELTYTNGNGVNNEVPSFTGELKRVAGEDVGAYEIQQNTVELADNEESGFKAGNYVIEYTPNKLTINPRPVTLTSATLEKTYDGIALVNADAPSLGVTINENKLLVEEGWVDGEGATYTFDGTQTLVGSSNNKFSYELKKNTKAENYTITKTEGTLTVTDDDVDTDKVITKTHEGSKFALGDTITFTIKVKNIYDEVKTITITEQEGVTITGESVFENVEPGAEVTTTAKYVVREQDILEQNFHNTATASFSGEKSFDGEDDATVEEANPAFAATKVITEEQQNETFGVGDTVSFKIIVENKGNVTLKNVTVGEDLKDATIKIGAGYTVDNNVATIASLAPNATVVVYAEYTVKQTDVDDADLVNTATVNAKDPDGKDLDTQKPSVNVPTDEKAPAMVAKKEIANPEAATGKDGKFKVGDTVEFNITVTNTGNVTLKDITVEEGLANAIIDKGDGYTVADNVATIVSLAPNNSVAVKAHYVVTQEDVDLGNLKNVATVKESGSDDPKKPVEPVPTEDPDPSYTVVKTLTNLEEATGTRTAEDGTETKAFKAGEKAKFDITVKNTGNVTLTDIKVTDILQGATLLKGTGYTLENATTAVITKLDPTDEAVVIKAEYVVTQTDVESGGTENLATSTAKGPGDPEKPTPVDPDPVKPAPVPTEDPTPAVAITKETTSKPADAVGYAEDETITYDIKATNTGNVTLHNVVITDEKTGDTWNVGTLVPNEPTDVYKASYKVTQADILVGEVENTAVVVGTPARVEKEVEVAAQAFEEVVPDNTVTASASVKDPTVKPSSALEVTKTVTSQGTTITIDGKDVTGYRVGDTIEFNIHVENTGNITLNNIVVNDVPTLDAGSPKGSITIAASTDGKYTVDGSTATIATLAPKASVDIKASYLVMAGDGTVKGNKLFNTAFATGTSEDPNNPQPGDSSKTDPVPIEPEPDDGNGAMEGSITVTKMITTSDGETPEDGVDAMIKVGLYDNASFSGQPIKTNTITISRGTSGNTVFDELDSTAGTVYYVAELDENGKPIIGDGAHLTGYGAPVYSANCKAGINPTTTKDTAASITNPLEAEEIEDDEKTSDTSKSTTSGSNKTTTSTKAAKTGDNTNMMIYWMLLGIAVLAGGVAVIYRKRKER